MWKSARILPVGVRSRLRRERRSARPSTSAVTRSWSHPRASVPRIEVTLHPKSAAKARPRSSASSCDVPVVTPPPRGPVGEDPLAGILWPGSLWEDIHLVEIPRTLIVTNDFPPRVGGIQRTLDSLCRELPPDRLSVIAPSCEGSQRFDASVPFEIVRERRRFVWPSPGVARRLEEAVDRTRADVVLFGDAFPLALMGSRLA